MMNTNSFINHLGIPERDWFDTEACEDYENNNIAHTFKSTKSFAYSDFILPMFARFFPSSESTFSVARSNYSIRWLNIYYTRYTDGHFIDPHDDNAYTMIDNIMYERKIAIIYYLTPPNYSKKDGGLFIDLKV